VQIVEYGYAHAPRASQRFAEDTMLITDGVTEVGGQGDQEIKVLLSKSDEMIGAFGI
jgi:hypothetical protein